MKSLLTALVLAALSLPGWCGEPFRLATYNLRLNTPSDGPNAWPHRKDRVLALARFHDWDVFGTQEALPDQIADMEEALEGFARIGVGRDDGAAQGEHAAIFVRRSRFEILRQGHFWLSETPERPSKGWDARCCHRIASWVELRDRRNPAAGSFYVFNAHFDHEGTVARRESARLMLSRWRELAGPAPSLLIGDFNSTPDSEPITLLASSLLDARQSSQTPPYGPVGTFNGFRIDAPMDQRIDYVFHTPGIQVLKYGVLSDSERGRFPSDHHPVVVTLRLP